MRRLSISKAIQIAAFSSVMAAAMLPVSCGGGGGGGTPTSPQSNTAPVISGLTVTPASGVSGVTIFTGTVSATDGDGDPLTYAWLFGPASLSGPSVSGRITGSGSTTLRVTVSDGNGGTTTGTRTVTVVTMSGTWDVVARTCSNDPYTMKLTQSGTRVTGTVTWPRPFCNASAGLTGRTDPAEPGTIDASRNVVLRLKAGVFIDYYMRGRLSADGRTFTGGLYKSGFNGEEFRATKR